MLAYSKGNVQGKGRQVPRPREKREHSRLRALKKVQTDHSTALGSKPGQGHTSESWPLECEPSHVILQSSLSGLLCNHGGHVSKMVEEEEGAWVLKSLSHPAAQIPTLPQDLWWEQEINLHCVREWDLKTVTVLFPWLIHQVLVKDHPSLLCLELHHLHSMTLEKRVHGGSFPPNLILFTSV